MNDQDWMKKRRWSGGGCTAWLGLAALLAVLLAVGV